MNSDLISESQSQRYRAAVKRRVLASVSATALLTTLAIAPASAQTAPAAAPVDEIVVTGSRIVRDGYQAPTPVTVMSAEAVQAFSQPNIADYVNTMPVFQGSVSPSTSQSSVSAGTAGVNTLNLRNAGGERTLVLFDGQRSVASTVTGLVDVNNFPQALIQRVDVVTGGASAAYGSDAVAGVVNFILDREFTGLKGETSGGITTYGDNANWKVSLTGGTPFSSGRGHVLINTEITHKDGIFDTSNRDWMTTGYGTMQNPAYSTNPALGSTSVPERLVLENIGGAQWAEGGLITSGPLKGIAFGPGTVPYNYAYGDLVSGGNMRGGEWRASEQRMTKGNSIDSRQNFRSVFGRASYEFSEAFEVFVQGSYNFANVYTRCCPQFNPANVTIRPDYAFFPAEIQARIAATTPAITQIQIGTMHPDLEAIYTDNTRIVTRWVAGANGAFDAMDSTWTWDAYYQMGLSRSRELVPKTYQRSRFLLALDAVRGPNGTIVCRSTLTNPGNGCIPYNALGVGVNSQAAIDYLMPGGAVGPRRNQTLEQNVGAVNFSGSPFELPAGPVSIAFGGEHRTEEVRGISDAGSQANDWFVGNYLPNLGKYSVTEGYLETVVPILSGAAMAESLEFNGAVRATDYSTSGYVTTWKLGGTWAPVQDIRFRATYSRDIRAPNLNNLFAAGTANTNSVLDPFNGNQPVTYQGFQVGNSALLPEKAQTLGLGAVYQPSWLPGFSASFDYYNIDLKDAIDTVSAQNIVNFCFQGNQAFCDAITRGVVSNTPNVITRIRISPFNTSVYISRGYDIEASYTMNMGDLIESWDGQLVVRGLATRTLRDYRDNRVNPPTDVAGASAPSWKYNASVRYSMDPYTVSLAVRGRSAGLQNNDWIVCTTGCPVSNTVNVTINDNYRDGTFYADFSFAYDISSAETDGVGIEAFLNVQNLLNADPARSPTGPVGSPFYTLLGDCGNGSDCQGRVFRTGLRFEM
jgi:iron complex outermembrane receptor protein